MAVSAMAAVRFYVGNVVSAGAIFSSYRVCKIGSNFGIGESGFCCQGCQRINPLAR